MSARDDEDDDYHDLTPEQAQRKLLYQLKRNQIVMKNVERNTSDGSAALAKIVGSGDKPGLAEQLRDVINDVKRITDEREEEAENRKFYVRFLIGQSIVSALALAAWLVNILLERLGRP